MNVLACYVLLIYTHTQVNIPDSQIARWFWIEQILDTLAVDLHVAHLEKQEMHMTTM